MIQIYSSKQVGPLIASAVLDPDSEIIIDFVYKPAVWQANKAYIEGTDIVLPTTFNGFYYRPSSGGISSATEPTTWVTLTGEGTTDNDVEWEAFNYNLFLSEIETITASAWVCSDVAVTLTLPSFTTETTKVKVTTIPSVATELTFTNTITFTDGTNIQKDDRSITYSIINK